MAAVLATNGCTNSSSSGPVTSSTSGVVSDAAGDPVGGATVYLIPSTAVDMTIIDEAAVLDGRAEAYDEPLEDLVRNGNPSFPQATTRADGSYTVFDVPEGDYFFFVQPGPSNAEHLPGGDLSRFSQKRQDFGGRSMDVKLSSSPSLNATFVGTSTCLICHPERHTQLSTLHKLGFRVPGVDGGLQDSSRFPDFDDGLVYLFDEGRTAWYHDFDGSRGFDKYRVSEVDPGPMAGVSLKADFFESGGRYFITLENIANPADPMSPVTYPVELTYGGGVFKQRYLVRVGQSRYPCVIQYQTQGNNGNNSRSRTILRDYHADYFYDESSQLLRLPPLDKSFEADCLGCHATGFSLAQDQVTGEWLADAANDRNGTFDIDGDGFFDEINLGCEVCHGPGSEHVVAANPNFIVNPDYLPPGRANIICGQCHSRPKGLGGPQGDAPLNSQNRMIRPGTSRATYIAEHTVRPDAALSSLWPDEVHAKSHRQQYNDHLRSPHYKNRREMITCWDCHLPHGDTLNRRQLTDDPATDNQCFRCHAIDPIPHMIEETGSAHIGGSTRCTDCHMVKTTQSGSGVKGNILDSLTNYWQNDITSHIMDVPRKTNVGVEGKTPDNAMPIPYTLRCGQACHVVDTLPQ